MLPDLARGSEGLLRLTTFNATFLRDVWGLVAWHMLVLLGPLREIVHVHEVL
jgi:hypothetical protein